MLSRTTQIHIQAIWKQLATTKAKYQHGNKQTNQIKPNKINEQIIRFVLFQT
jgi:hypothetical protein